jgi:hypothetical protein
LLSFLLSFLLPPSLLSFLSFYCIDYSSSYSDE